MICELTLVKFVLLRLFKLKLISYFYIDRYSVRLGEHDIRNDNDGATRHLDVEISSRTAHEGFNSVSFQNDIAIIKLAKRVEFTCNYIKYLLQFA